MSSHLSRDEQALDELIARAEELLVVCLSEPHHPGGLMMVDRVRAICEPQAGVQLLHLGFTAYRRWARRHRSFGTPTVLIFHRGNLARRYIGVIEEETVRAALQELE
ncbi:hypothetical protein KQI84_15105 [bacterium]|nr:hypothetical protein [bacterium]